MKKVIGATAISFSILFAGIAGTVSLVPAVYAQETVEKHQTTAVVKDVDQENGRVTLIHDPVPALDWPAMTMGFSVADRALLKDVKVGEKVTFTFTDKNSKFVITQIERR